jgi:hypothetical protein
MAAGKGTDEPSRAKIADEDIEDDHEGGEAADTIEVSSGFCGDAELTAA